MTPNLNANPLAALIANATKPPAGTDIPLNPGAALAGQSGDVAEPENKFYNILQSHKELTSSVLENGMVGEQIPFAAQSVARHGQAQPVPGLNLQAQAVKALSQHEQALNPDMEAVFADQGLLVSSLPVPVPVPDTTSAPLVAEPAAGLRSPRRGNSLPPSVQIGHTGQPIGLETEGIELTQSALLARAAPPTPAVLQHPANHPLANGLTQSIPVPELAEQLARFPKPAPGIGIGGVSSGLVQGMQGLSELAMSASDTDATTGAELIRGNALVAAPERQAAVQSPPAIIPLSRLAGAPGWDQGLGQRILWMVDNGLNRAELRLDPPHLGSVNVRISMQDDQAQLLFQAANPAAREALESAMPRLREMFAQQGLQLGSADVSDQNDPSAGGNADRESEHLADDSAGPIENSTVGQAADEGSQAGPGRLSGIDQSAGNSLIDEFV